MLLNLGFLLTQIMTTRQLYTLIREETLTDAPRLSMEMSNRKRKIISHKESAQGPGSHFWRWSCQMKDLNTTSKPQLRFSMGIFEKQFNYERLELEFLIIKISKTDWEVCTHTVGPTFVFRLGEEQSWPAF